MHSQEMQCEAQASYLFTSLITLENQVTSKKVERQMAFSISHKTSLTK